MIRERQSSGIVTEEYRSSGYVIARPSALLRSERRKLARAAAPASACPAKCAVGSPMLAGCFRRVSTPSTKPPIWGVGVSTPREAAFAVTRVTRSVAAGRAARVAHGVLAGQPAPS